MCLWRGVTDSDGGYTVQPLEGSQRSMTAGLQGNTEEDGERGGGVEGGRRS